MNYHRPDAESFKTCLTEYDIQYLKDLNIDPEKHSMLDQELAAVLDAVYECLRLKGEAL